MPGIMISSTTHPGTGSNCQETKNSSADDVRRGRTEGGGYIGFQQEEAVSVLCLFKLTESGT